MFVGGLGGGRYMGSGHIAELLRWEMSQRAGDRTATFAVRQGSVAAEAVYQIERTDAAGTVAVVDVYGYQPRMVLDAESTPARALTRVITLALTVLAGVLIWTAAAARSSRRRKSAPQMLQLLLCLLMLFALGAYFLTAVYALVDALWLALRPSGNGPGSAPVISWPQWAVLIGAVTGLLAPNLRTRLTEAGELYQRIMRYTWTASVRNRLTGDLQDLLDRVNQRPEIQTIHLVGFSFGALLALDTLLPTSGRPAPIQQIRSLVTIGCPFELIEMLHPAYGRARTPATPQPFTWINVYQPIDVLASTFGAGHTRTRPAVPILADGTHRHPDMNIAWNAEFTLTPVNFLMLPSFYSHGQYWDQNTGCRSAFGSIVDALYSDTPALR